MTLKGHNALWTVASFQQIVGVSVIHGGFQSTYSIVFAAVTLFQRYDVNFSGVVDPSSPFPNDVPEYGIERFKRIAYPGKR